MEIELGDRFYLLRVRKLRQARSIAVSADTVKGEVRLTMPLHVSTAQALRFVQSKSDWLVDRFAEALPPVPIVNGAEIAFAGESHFISWSRDFSRKPLKIGDEIRVGGPEDRIQSRVLDWMKAQARDAYVDDLAYYCVRAGSDLPTLSVGDARRRWGSCSGRQAIRMNWRLIMAPPMVRRSVVAHEVAHLRHMNHSPAFYALLDEIFEGKRRDADRWLKQHGSALHLIGAPARTA
ncbi:MAG: SprT family zinc-dependent metalloprotease [Parasphingorhabdus sp.]